jgi:hypothetical protein
LIVFFGSLTGYAHLLEGKSQLEDSIALFTEVLGLTNCPCLLVLSKPDLLPSMLQKVPLGMYYQDYLGDTDVTKATEYMKNCYLDACSGEDKQRVHPVVLNVTGKLFMTYITSGS